MELPHGDSAMTPSHKEALEWLRKHGGDAAFDKFGVALAMGENAPFMRSTWNALAQAGLVEFYNPFGKGRGRVRLTARMENE